VGIGVDYGIYIYSRLESFLRAGLPLQEAYFETLKSTGKAVLFTGLCLAVGVATWMFSAIKFQADMGLMLTFMFIVNMFGALWLLPALARFLISSQRLAGKERSSVLAHCPSSRWSEKPQLRLRFFFSVHPGTGMAGQADDPTWPQQQAAHAARRSIMTADQSEIRALLDQWEIGRASGRESVWESVVTGRVR